MPIPHISRLNPSYNSNNTDVTPEPPGLMAPVNVAIIICTVIGAIFCFFALGYYFARRDAIGSAQMLAQRALDSQDRARYRKLNLESRLTAFNLLAPEIVSKMWKETICTLQMKLLATNAVWYVASD